MRRERGIILALDLMNREKALEVCRQVRDYIAAVKVGYPLVLSSGIGIVREVKKISEPVIADFKVADIPAISQQICRIAKKNGADYAVVHGFLGEDVVEACSKIIKIFVVASMSHRGSLDFISRHSKQIVEVARRHAYGIVAPATRASEISELRELAGNLKIISPGIKAQGAEPGSAIRAGADFEIIGRAIYQAREPRRAAAEFSRIIANVSFFK